MEETMASPMFTDILNFLALGLSIVLLFVVAYLWSSNSNKTAQIETIQSELQRLKRKVSTLEAKVNELREPTVVSEVQQIDPFGLDLSDNRPLNISPAATVEPWRDMVEEYNELAEQMAAPGQLKKCERFVQDYKLKILTYGGAMTFRPAIDVKDSSYWAFKCSGSGNEFAVIPNPMNPCDEDLHEHGGLKEIFALNYQSGVYRKYSIKLPAIFVQDPARGWQIKNPGVVNLERK